MAHIIKTIEAWRDRDRVLAWLTRRNATPNLDRYLYFFTLGRGHPKQTVERLYFTFQGKIIGWFEVEDIVANVGEWADFVGGGSTMEQVTGRQRPISYKDREGSTWTPKLGVWLVLCPPPFHLIEERLCYSGFQGFRYLDLESYRKTLDAKVFL